jgi:hypothetical protein
MSLSNVDLAAEFEQLARLAGELATHVRKDGDLPARQLAAALVEGGRSANDWRNSTSSCAAWTAASESETSCRRLHGSRRPGRPSVR